MYLTTWLTWASLHTRTTALQVLSHSITFLFILFRLLHPHIPSIPRSGEVKVLDSAPLPPSTLTLHYLPRTGNLFSSPLLFPPFPNGQGNVLLNNSLSHSILDCYRELIQFFFLSFSLFY